MSRTSTSGDPWIRYALLGAGALIIVLGIVQQRRESAARELSAPQLSLPLLEGGKRVSPVPGRVTLVDFWASWCEPCKASMPKLQRLLHDYSARGVDLYSVDTDSESADREALVREFLLQNRLQFPTVVIDDGSASIAFKVASIPALFVLDQRGRVAWSRVGLLQDGDERELRSLLDETLQTPPR